MLIVDKVLEPFFIKKDGSSFDLYRRMTPKARPDGTVPKPYDRFHSSCSSLLAAVDTVIGEKMNKKDIVSLKDYIDEIRSLKKTFLQVTHDDLDSKFLAIEKRLFKIEERFIPENAHKIKF